MACVWAFVVPPSPWTMPSVRYFHSPASDAGMLGGAVQHGLFTLYNTPERVARSDLFAHAKPSGDDPFLYPRLRLPEFLRSQSEARFKFPAELRNLSVRKRVGHLLYAICRAQLQKRVIQSLSS